ncbi:Rap family tetratricopeptide repeat protein [Priestia taiwanensis]|uniref:Aspartate phosphatase n=1 Tax=Priestia taiwanensis TaxID=1347902 RepID=A0A917AP01_9BACI|nr:Rap family tetratricopeptide repeat protein [Priestia taiwanensis]MBM7362632.1 tetratricopeptide (TPR) repeat protein [Priestia taiwanensis]GGE63821.1 aspartate phosphatase [Priestia taiwanensis]
MIVGIGVITKQEITYLLNDWYQEMRVQRVLKASQLKKEIDSKINGIEEDRDILNYYGLLNFRYEMLVGNFKEDLNESITDEQTNNLLNYYYHFFKFIYAMEVGNYSDARQYYEVAESLLIHIPDEVEKAEFNYRISTFQYYLSQPVLAIHYATKAQEFFSRHKGYEVKTGACKNVLGSACNTLGQYELAEEYLLEALDIFKKANEHSLAMRVRHNLGLLYADQGLSEVAIRHLSEAIEDYKYDTTIYLLAREHFKLNHRQEVAKYVEEGLKVCEEKYRHHFSILEAKNNHLLVDELEGVFLQAIEYFKEYDLWKDVMLYSEELAKEWFDAGNELKASTYFYMSYDAKKIFQTQGALK